MTVRFAFRIFIVTSVFLIILTTQFQSPVNAHETPEHVVLMEQDGDDTRFDAPGDYLGRVNSLGAVRGYFLHVPEGYDGETPMPLLISLHGAGGDPIQNAERSDFSEIADEEGFIVVYPGGRGNPPLWYSRDRFPEGFQDDVTFIRDLIEYLETQLNVDASQVFATGISNGGGMAHRLACDLSDRVVGIAPVAGAISSGDACDAEFPVSVLVLHGEEDQIAPLDGEEGLSDPLDVYAADWAARNGCEMDSSNEDLQDGIRVERWDNCEREAAVDLVVYEAYGHTWFPDASKRIWEFFEQHPRIENLEGVNESVSDQ